MDILIQLGKQTAALFEKGQKGYRRLRTVAAILAVILSFILGAIVGTTVPQNGGAVSQAGQSLMAVDGFLAAASGSYRVLLLWKVVRVRESIFISDDGHETNHCSRFRGDC